MDSQKVKLNQKLKLLLVLDLLLREILQTSPADQEVRLDRSRGTCLLEGELTSQCAQRICSWHWKRKMRKLRTLREMPGQVNEKHTGQPAPSARRKKPESNFSVLVQKSWRRKA